MLDAVSPISSEGFLDLLERFRSAASVGTDDVISVVRGLLDEVRDQHDQNMVACLDRIDLLIVKPSGELSLGRVPIGQASRRADIDTFDVPTTDPVTIVRDVHVYDDGDGLTSRNRSIAAADQVPDRPLFFPGYDSWERALGHHDPLTDVFHLGMLMGSLATRLDFRETADLQTFVQHRTNLQRLNPRLHPVVARLIADMTELARSARAADLEAIVEVLDTYRSVELDDAALKAGEIAKLDDPVVRRNFRLKYFRNRLFEVTRRNKLLYFSERHGADLTRASFPLMLDYRTLQARKLLTTTPEFLNELAGLYDESGVSGELDLRRWLQTVDYPFLASDLEKLRASARRDQRELGFNQLRLVLAFFRWHDDDRQERVNTPLVMIPVSLRKLPGSTDGFGLRIEGSVDEAEVNPVLRYVLAERFRIELPETIDLRTLAPLRQLCGDLEQAIRHLKPGVAVALTDKPKIHVLQKTIRRRLDDHNRRQRRAGHKLKDWEGISYSYAADSYQPLGTELFERFVRPRAAPGRELVGSGLDAGDIAPDLGPGQLFTSESFTLESHDRADPLNWEIDLCAVTLANFNTRKMSLVRDYRALLSEFSGSHASYERLFEHGVRPALAPTQNVRHVERNFVLPADPSQAEAILRAASGQSYVIQGPPGTGKSQTIANLLVSLAAAGKSVLFVCEKRVALDVVHERLTSAGVGHLACLVHDARDDRLPFIADLKALYQDWQSRRRTDAIDQRRMRLVSEIEALVIRLEKFSSLMMSPAAEHATVRDLMGVALAERWAMPDLSYGDRERLPTWDEFRAGETALSALEHAMANTNGGATAIVVALRAIKADLVDLPRPMGVVETLLADAGKALEAFEALEAHAVRSGSQQVVSLRTLAEQAQLAARLRNIVVKGQLGLVDPLSPETVRLQKQLLELAELDRKVDDLCVRNQGWIAKPGLPEALAALGTAQHHEGRFWSFLSPKWRTVRTLMAQQHRGSVDRIVDTLARLVAELQAHADRTAFASRIEDAFGIADATEVHRVLRPIWDGQASTAELALVETCLSDPARAGRIVAQLGAGHMRLARARDVLGKLFNAGDLASSAELRQWIDTLAGLKDTVVDLVRPVRSLERASPSLADAWRKLVVDLETLRAGSLHGAIDGALLTAPEVAAMRSADVGAIAKQIGTRLMELRQLNAKAAMAAGFARFSAKIASDDPGHRQGRAFLEHQFSLQRPSAPMRSLLSDAQGQVVRDLKPIWMMSPLSVADTLPLKDDLFDVVVFDEASQIPIEDALPTLYRAPQAIVVGDEMQLPPPSYFARKLETDTEELPDYIAFGMQAESLLDKALHALPATRLEWHYRSKHESLIGFCNQAFYAGRLKTVPSRHELVARTPIETAQGAPMKAMAERVLGRPISFHRVENGVYDRQRNPAEAGYIAEVVKALLAQDSNKSIGIVAFSQPQQDEIEDALERLANENTVFGQRLEKARAREHEELFVKNLENVQGDERDIILVSVAYAPDPSGRMLMNFGPINQEGGEKRLNVIFSRAKHHVAVVTSFDPGRITNDYNKGANALKRYLMYARAASVGDTEGMRSAVAGYPGAERVETARRLPDPLADLVAETLASDGKDVVRGLGQSTLRCDVAIRDAGGHEFATVILTDNAAHYEIADVVDRYVTIPSLLEASGWQVEFALAKDWIGRDRLRRRGPAC